MGRRQPSEWEMSEAGTLVDNTAVCIDRNAPVVPAAGGVWLTAYVWIPSMTQGDRVAPMPDGRPAASIGQTTTEVEQHGVNQSEENG